MVTKVMKEGVLESGLAAIGKRLAAIAIVSVGISFSHSANAQDADLAANKKVAYEAIELWLSDTNIKPESIMAPDYVNHLDSQIGDKSASQARSIDAFKEELAKFHAAFSDVKVTSKLQVAEGNMVSTRVQLSAVHSGSYLGEKPTGKTINYDSVEFTRIENGKVTETWVTWDKYAMFKQIGLIQ